MIIWSPYRLQSNRLWEVILSVRRSICHPSFTSRPSFFLLSHHSLTVSLFLSPLCVWHTALTDRLKGKGSSVLSAGDRTTQATIWQSVLHCLCLIIQTNHTYKHDALCRKSRPWGVKMVWVYFCTLHKKMVHVTTNNQAYCFKANNFIHNLFRRDDCCICSNIAICCIHCLRSQLVSRCTEISQPNRHHISLFKLAIQTKYPRDQLGSCHDWALGIHIFFNVTNYEPHFANQLLLYIYIYILFSMGMSK